MIWRVGCLFVFQGGQIVARSDNYDGGGGQKRSAEREFKKKNTITYRWGELIS